MKSKTLPSAVRALSLLLLISATCALAQNGPFAQNRKLTHFSGLFNDYVPLSPTISGSPYEMHGQWTMDIRPEWGTADFAADMTMSGYGKTAMGAVDPTQPLVNPHTHHIRLTNVRIAWDMVGCPAWGTPTLQGFQINGTVSLITGNGTNGTFEPNPPQSTLQVCVSGGDNVQFSIPNSNVTLVFGGPAAAKHFGSQAIHGVVRIASADPIGKF